MPNKKRTKAKTKPQPQQRQEPILRPYNVTNIYPNTSKQGSPYWTVYFQDGQKALLFDRSVANQLGFTKERISFNPPQTIAFSIEERSYGKVITAAEKKTFSTPTASEKDLSIARMSVLKSVVELMAVFPELNFSDVLKAFESYVLKGEAPQIEFKRK